MKCSQQYNWKDFLVSNQNIYNVYNADYGLLIMDY